ncbi:MAG: hypothetical protein KAU23_09165, partial [Anaerolineales bacterium]|nr:hypothetical protein [Anaerolineales bacterium]
LTDKYFAPHLNNELFIKAPLLGYNPLGMDKVITTSNKPIYPREFKEVISQIYRCIPQFF